MEPPARSSPPETIPSVAQAAPRTNRHLLLAGVIVGGIVVVAHLAVATSLLTAPPHLGLGAVGVGIVMIAIIKVVLLGVFAQTGSSRGMHMLTRIFGSHSDMTSGRTIRGARFYDRLVALTMLGRDRKLRQQTIDLARLAPGDSVLEIGCGTGEVAMRAKRRIGPTGSIAGIDPSPEMIELARRKATQLGLDIDYLLAAVEALPFADSTFDMVLSSLMMHHLPDDLKPQALSEIQRVLKPGGRLFVVDFRSPSSHLGRLAPVWQLHRSTAGSLESTTALMRKAGFRVVETGATRFSYLGYVMAESRN